MRAVLAIILLGLTVGIALLIPRVSQPPSRFDVAMNLMENGRAEEAASLFQDPIWQGVAEYQAGRYRRTLSALFGQDDVVAYYNTGNAYAKLYEWAGAKAAYRRVLLLDPSHEDARHNLDVVERAEQLELQQRAQTSGQTNDGRWREGEYVADDTVDPDDEQLKTEQGAAPDSEATEFAAAERPSANAGQSDVPGLAGDQVMSDGSGSGVSSDLGMDGAETDLPGAANTAHIRRASDQAAEIMLRQIEDDPERVLAARLRSAHRLRKQAEGTCSDC